MTRRELRQHIFEMLFRVEFNAAEEMADQKAMFIEDLNSEKEVSTEDEAYILGKFDKIAEKIEEIDTMINSEAKGWKTTRMGKVELTILRLAVYEMKFDEDVPTKVAINEAVELAKMYAQEESPAFINGVLGKLAQ